MEQMDTLDHLGGNTKTPRCVLGKYWCFTLNNYTKEEMDHLEQTFETLGYKYGFGEEVGEQGTEHLQGWIESTSRIRPTEKIKNKRIHWEKTRGNREQNIKYCSKGGKYKTNLMTLEKKKELLGIPTVLYDWQSEVLERVKIRSDREILWIWSVKGNTGKTTLAKLLTLEYNAVLLDGKKSDILYAATEYLTKLPEEESFCKAHIFILDLSRTTENFVSYDAIEKLKNGYWFSGKYESKMIMIPPPRVVIFSNFPPNKSAMSEDRWKCIRIDKNE